MKRLVSTLALLSALISIAASISGCGAKNDNANNGNPFIPGAGGIIPTTVGAVTPGPGGSLTINFSGTAYNDNIFISAGRPGPGYRCPQYGCYCGDFAAYANACWIFSNDSHGFYGSVSTSMATYPIISGTSLNMQGISVVEPGASVQITASYPMGNTSQVVGRINLPASFVSRNFGGVLPAVTNLVFDFKQMSSTITPSVGYPVTPYSSLPSGSVGLTGGVLIYTTSQNAFLGF